MGRTKVTVLSGREAVLAAVPLISDLSLRCGQAGETKCVPYFVSTRENQRKIPHLLLVYSEFGSTDVGLNLMGAVLIYEYCLAGVGMAIFSTADCSGRRNVWAAQEQRAGVAARAARALWERSAQIVQIIFSATHDSEMEGICCNHEGCLHRASGNEQHPCGVIAAEMRFLKESQTAGSWALMEREIPMFLPLLATMEKTLARIGQHTRFNLRYYRRRTERDLGCEFRGNVRVSLAELQEFNLICAFPVSDELLRWRFASLGPDGFSGVVLHGICDRRGDWLSLVCGRSHNRFFELDWQMNRADAAAYSLSLVMRSCLIEHEIAQRSTRLYIEGGSVHPIMNSFAKGRVGELTLKRRSVFAWMFERLAKKVLPAKNYLAQTIHDPALEWRSLAD